MTISTSAPCLVSMQISQQSNDNSEEGTSAAGEAPVFQPNTTHSFCGRGKWSQGQRHDPRPPTCAWRTHTRGSWPASGISLRGFCAGLTATRVYFWTLRVLSAIHSHTTMGWAGNCTFPRHAIDNQGAQRLRCAKIQNKGEYSSWFATSWTTREAQEYWSG